MSDIPWRTSAIHIRRPPFRAAFSVTWLTMDPQDIRIAIQGWADEYHARIDGDLTTAWSDLELRLRDLVDSMSLKELTIGPGEDFQKRLQKTAGNWSTAHVAPILEDAERELGAICQTIQDLHGGPGTIPGKWRGTLKFSDAWGPGAAAGGVAVGVVAVMFGVGKATAWLVFAVIVVNWYLVIAGVIVGTIMVFFGGYGALGLMAKLRDRFRQNLLPRIRDVILGEYFELDGKKMPSVRRSLHDMIEQGKADAIHSLVSGIV